MGDSSLVCPRLKYYGFRSWIECVNRAELGRVASQFQVHLLTMAIVSSQRHCHKKHLSELLRHWLAQQCAAAQVHAGRTTLMRGLRLLGCVQAQQELMGIWRQFEHWRAVCNHAARSRVNSLARVSQGYTLLLASYRHHQDCSTLAALEVNTQPTENGKL